jgi:hypothetical protein
MGDDASAAEVGEVIDRIARLGPFANDLLGETRQ